MCKTLNHCAILALFGNFGTFGLVTFLPACARARFFAFCKSEQGEFRAICHWRVGRQSFINHMTSTFWSCQCWLCWCWWCGGWGWLSSRGRGQCQRMGTKQRVGTLPSLRPRNAPPTSNSTSVESAAACCRVTLLYYRGLKSQNFPVGRL